MRGKLLAAGVATAAVLAVGLAVFLLSRPTREADLPESMTFDWEAIDAMIASGESFDGTYNVKEVELRRVPMPDAKVFLVVDGRYEALLGPKRALVVYYPETGDVIHDPEYLKTLLETAEYDAKSPDELLELTCEVAPLLYGSDPAQHEIVTESDLVGSGRLPITKDAIDLPEGHDGLFVNYYAKLGPWGDLVNVTAVLFAGRLRISIQPIFEVPRIYR